MRRTYVTCEREGFIILCIQGHMPSVLWWSGRYQIWGCKEETGAELFTQIPMPFVYNLKLELVSKRDWQVC